MSQQHRSPPAVLLDTPVSSLAGIGPKRAQALAESGLECVADVIAYLPSRYQDWRERTPIAELKPGIVAVLEGELSKIDERPMRGRGWRRLATGWLTIDGKRIRIVWFNLPAYMRGYMPGGQRVLVRGRISLSQDGALELAHPDVISLVDGTPRPVRSVYRLPAAIGQRLFENVVARVLSDAAHLAPNSIPGEIRGDAMTVGDALRYLHEPPDDADPAALQAGDSEAHHTLAFDELFAFELALALEHRRSQQRAGAALVGEPALTKKLAAKLSFPLTNAQRQAISEIVGDLAQPTQMNRLLMGDVGSGKTVVAFWAALRAVESGYQAAMMAPTELLAEQHFRSFNRMCAGIGVRSALLTGRIAGYERNTTLEGLARGDIDVVFGTQAVIQQRVRIAKLGLGIIDEQHRFGVFDRARLKALGATANVLMMTATPIPRSLAMSLFGNLSLSFLDEMPPGRMPIATELRSESDSARIQEELRDEIARGGRIYYVVPLIEGEDDEAKSVANTASRLARSVREARIATLHGRMRSAEKDRAMRAFRDGALDVLVSTTVVEVGIDVPEATVIVIAAAERYGLAQLHQLRGRVGRGSAPSRCVLVASDDADESALARLQVMQRAPTGREVAEADLALRGPGDLLGVRQTGALPLKFVHLVRDVRMIERARELAEQWLTRDPSLDSAASAGARTAVRKMLTQGFSLGDVG
jgi:ATP-dependent DNA helicase RecG